jgi:osmotically-inducible protein OsmY
MAGIQFPQEIDKTETEIEGCMRDSRYLILAALVGLTVAGSGCTQKSADEATNATGAAVDKTKAATDTAFDKTKEGANKALDATKESTATAIDETQKAGEKTADATRNVAEKTVDKTKEIAGGIATKTKEFSATTGEVITDAWITTKVKAKFADETLLKGSNINVDSGDHVVTLKGTVASAPAKERAATIARGTEGVTRVVNQLVVK